MGFLTTFTVYNDGADQIKENAKEVAEAIYDGMNNMSDSKQYPIGNHCNLIKGHATRHADSWTCYVHMGNTVCELNPYSKETQQLMKNNKEYFLRMLEYMEYTSKQLRKEIKKSK